MTRSGSAWVLLGHRLDHLLVSLQPAFAAGTDRHPVVAGKGRKAMEAVGISTGTAIPRRRGRSLFPTDLFCVVGCCDQE